MDKQTKLVMQLLCITLAIAALFLPWMTVMSVTVSLFDLQFGPVILVFILFGTGLIICGFSVNDLPAFPLIRAALWAVNLSAALGYLVYWLSIAEVGCLGVAAPIFLVSSMVLVMFEVASIPHSRLSTAALVAGVTCLLCLVIGLASGRSALNTANGQKMPRDAKTAIANAMKQFPFPFPNPFSANAPGVAPSPTSPPEPPQVRVTVGSWSESYQLGKGYEVYKPEEGKKFIICSVNVTNISNERLSVDSSNFELTGSDRNIYGASSFTSGGGMGLLAADTLPQGNATGNVVFEVGRSVQPVNVEFKPDPMVLLQKSLSRLREGK